MGFLDKAKQAANDLAAKADTAMQNAGVAGPSTGGLFGGGQGGASAEVDRALRDLGVLTWTEQQGATIDPADRERVQATLRSLQEQGRLAGLTLSSAYATGAVPPPPPGAATAPPPPPASAAPAGDDGSSGGGTTPPPPPPSWA